MYGVVDAVAQTIELSQAGLPIQSMSLRMSQLDSLVKVVSQ
ncbi:hypothetical protein CRENPOLYSF2_700005 [Crenothrix polyspora]|uniref:Uncharacterized protein n=1 Tax=Crenothrix polyspora TaxID=360316 RepID=A0A1R4HHP9_9GAMM|nr:hypothetical protein CRENPOLYSF2_700005 [Crenothrix polyspora]